MPTPRCLDFFRGPVSQFIEQFAQRTFLPAATVAQARGMVMSAMSEGALLVVRNFGRYQKAAGFLRWDEGEGVVPNQAVAKRVRNWFTL